MAAKPAGRKRRRTRRAPAGRIPRESRNLGDDRPGVSEFPADQQVGSAFGFDRREQVFITLADRRKEELAQAPFRPLLDVVDHGDQAAVVGVLVGADAVKANAQRLDPAPKQLRHSKNGGMAAPTHLEGKRDQRIDVAKGAEGRENNPHAGGCSLHYDGSL